jgi:hypothetical protein
VGALILGVGCGRYSSSALGISIKPPEGFKLVKESAASGKTPAHAAFDHGLDLYVVHSHPMSSQVFLDPVKLPIPENLIFQALQRHVPGAVDDYKSIDLPIGKASRFTFHSVDDRTIAYYVPGATLYVVATLTAPPAQFDQMTKVLDQAIRSLKIRE